MASNIRRVVLLRQKAFIASVLAAGQVKDGIVAARIAEDRADAERVARWRERNAIDGGL